MLMCNPISAYRSHIAAFKLQTHCWFSEWVCVNPPSPKNFPPPSDGLLLFEPCWACSSPTWFKELDKWVVLSPFVWLLCNRKETKPTRAYAAAFVIYYQSWCWGHAKGKVHVFQLFFTTVTAINFFLKKRSWDSHNCRRWNLKKKKITTLVLK